MKVKSKEEVILAAVESLKKSEYKATAIKVELEAQFNRDGEWCGEFSECYNCEGGGCDSCENTGEMRCDCEGQGSEYGNTSNCHRFIMERLEPLGLSQQIDGVWKPKLPLVFAKFYNDGSVDSEFTFTLMLDKPENVLVLPKVIEVFNQLGEEIGNDVDLDGAGMHMALLNDKKGHYSNSDFFGPSVSSVRRLQNFNKAMQLLMPALFCLGASQGKSRGLAYRRPMVGASTHRAAIDLRGNALEFRVFDTCYSDPEQILDNVVVMSKCMRYWSLKKKNNGLGKIVDRIQFGIDDGYELNRFYTTIKHIDLLNAGLMKLKPSYYSLGQIKRERGMTTTKRTINSKVKKFREGLEVEYKEYVERFEWSLVVRKQQRLADMLARYDRAPSTRPMSEFEKEVEEYIASKRKELKQLNTYIQEREQQFNEQQGSYTLCAA